MADNTEIYKVEFDFGDADKRLEDINKALDENKTRIAILQAQQKAGIKLSSDERKEILQLTETNRKLGAEQRNLIKITTEQLGSLNQQRAQLIDLRIQYDRLTESERENGEEGKRLKKEINLLNDSITKTETNTGRFGRVVGQYAKEIGGALSGTGKFGQAVNGVGNILKASPLFLLVSVLSAITSAFSKAQPVIDFFAEQMSGLSNIFSVLLQRAGLLFSAITKALTGDFKGAVADGKAAFDNLGNAMAEARRQGIGYAQALKEIEDGLANLTVAESRNSAQIAKLNAQLRNRTLTDKERLAIAKQITDLENETFKTRQRLLNDQLKQEKQQLVFLLQQAGVRADVNDSTENLIQLAQKAQIEDAKWQKVISAQNAVYKSQEESLSLIERTTTRLDQINQQAAERRERESATRAANLEKEKALIEAQAKLITELNKKEVEENLKALDLAFKSEEAARKSAYADELQAAEGNLQAQEEITKRYQDESVRLKSEQLAREILELQDYAGQVEGVETTIAAKQIELSNMVTDAKLADINEVAKKQKEAADKAVKESEDQAKRQSQIFAQLANQLGEDITAAVNDIFEGQENATERFLAATITTVLDSIEAVLVAQQAATIAATTAGDIAKFGLAGLITAGIKIAAIKGAFAVAKGLIRSTIPKFEGGGIIPGGYEQPGFSRSGDNTLILAKPGEVVLNKSQQANLGGAAALAAAGVPGFANGGVVPNLSAPPADNGASIVDAIRNLSIFTNITEVMNAAGKVTKTTNRRKL